jgi:hypothetical protein
MCMYFWVNTYIIQTAGFTYIQIQTCRVPDVGLHSVHSVHKVYTKCAQSVKDKCEHLFTRVHNENDLAPNVHKIYQNVGGDHNICFFVHTLVLSASWSVRIAGVVGRPEHGPGTDVVELTSASRPVPMITFASGIVARKSAPSMGNSPVLAVGHQSKSAQNVSHRDGIDYRLWRRL